MQEIIHVTDTERVKKPIRMHQKSAKTHLHPISYYVIANVHKINSNTYDKAYLKMTYSRSMQ